jgi:hypothetical protein
MLLFAKYCQYRLVAEKLHKALKAAPWGTFQRKFFIM